MITLTSLIGYAGILLNNRAFLAVYTLLLWVCFALMVTPGYMTYKQRTFNLEGKINSQWSRNLGAQGRLRIQDAVGVSFYPTCVVFFPNPHISISDFVIEMCAKTMSDCSSDAADITRPLWKPPSHLSATLDPTSPVANPVISISNDASSVSGSPSHSPSSLHTYSSSSRRCCVRIISLIDSERV